MRFDPYNFDTKYSDMMLNFLSGQVSDEMKSERDIEKALKLEKLKQGLKKQSLIENLTAMQKSGLLGDMTGGGAGPSYRTGLDVTKTSPLYIKGLSDEMLPEYAIRQPEDIKALDFQNRISQYMTAKETPKPDASMVKAPKDTIRRSLLARNVEKSLTPEFAGRNFIQGSKGEFKERDQTPNVFMNVPAGYEVSGYDGKGNPKITKIKEPKVDRTKNKVSNNISLLMQKQAPLEDIESYIRSEGFTPKEFDDLFRGKNYTVRKKKGFLGLGK